MEHHIDAKNIQEAVAVTTHHRRSYCVATLLQILVWNSRGQHEYLLF